MPIQPRGALGICPWPFLLSARVSSPVAATIERSDRYSVRRANDRHEIRFRTLFQRRHLVLNARSTNIARRTREKVARTLFERDVVQFDSVTGRSSLSCETLHFFQRVDIRRESEENRRGFATLFEGPSD